MKPPSKDWTPQERLNVIRALSDQMAQLAQAKVPLLGLQLFQLSERLRFVSSANETFLENNRDQILKEIDFEKEVPREPNPCE